MLGATPMAKVRSTSSFRTCDPLKPQGLAALRPCGPLACIRRRVHSQLYIERNEFPYEVPSRGAICGKGRLRVTAASAPGMYIKGGRSFRQAGLNAFTCLQVVALMLRHQPTLPKPRPS